MRSRALFLFIAATTGCRDECEGWVHLWAAGSSSGELLAAGDFGGAVTLFGESLSAPSVSASFLARLDAHGSPRWVKALETFPAYRSFSLFPPYASSKVVAADDGDAAVTGGGAAATRYDRDGTVVWRWPLDPRAYQLLGTWVRVGALSGGRTAIIQATELVVVDRQGGVLWRRSVPESLVVERLLGSGDALFIGGSLPEPLSLDVSIARDPGAPRRIILARIEASGDVSWVKGFGDRAGVSRGWAMDPAGSIVGLAEGAGLASDGVASSLAVFEVDLEGRLVWMRDAGPSGFRVWALAAAGDHVMVAGQGETGVTLAAFGADGAPRSRVEVPLVPSHHVLRSISLAPLDDRMILTGMAAPARLDRPLDCEVASVMALVRADAIDRVILGAAR